MASSSRCPLAAFPAPLPLLVTDEQGRFCVVVDTARALARIAKPVVVVAIVGRYRTGKSFLMNRLAGTRAGSCTPVQAFPLGSTVEAHTKGIWVWLRPHPRDQEKCLLLLDTEGQGDIHSSGSEHDTWLFVLAMLLSSTLLFNTKGTLDKEGMEQLHFILNLADHVRTKEHQKDDRIGSDFHRHFPSLVMCMRDFTLHLEVGGRPCTADDYMEHCLQMRKKGLAKACREFNEQREMLCGYFKERKCFVFPVPAEAQHLEHLEELPDDRLNPKFLSVADNLIKYILDSAKVKHVCGTVISTHTFIELVEQYASAQRAHALPCMESALVQVVTLANRQAKEAALALYREAMGPVAERLSLPTLELNARHQEGVEAAVALFHGRSVLDKDHAHEKELMKEITEVYKGLIMKNAEASQCKCKERLLQLYQPIKVKVQQREFYRPGGFQEYQALMENLQENYNSTPGLGMAQENVLKVFMDQTKDTGSNILMMDKGISQMERNTRENDERKKRLEQGKRALQEQNNQKQVQMESLKNQLETNKTEFDKKVKRMKEQTLSIPEDMDIEDDSMDMYDMLENVLGFGLKVAFTVLLFI
ncbi:guanylate-binding protein 2-like [Lampetra planeri]